MFRRRSLMRHATLCAFMGLAVSGAMAQSAAPRKVQSDTVENGVVAVRPPKLNNLPLFDRRMQQQGPEEFESMRWLFLQNLKANPQLIDNRQAAVTYARMFLPPAGLERFFDCAAGGSRAGCAKAMAGTTVFSRFNRSDVNYAIGSNFRGNEFESARLHQEFVSSYGPRLVAAAAPLPQEAYIAVVNSLQPYSAAEGEFKFSSSTPFMMNGQREIGLQNNFCALTDTVFPAALKLNAANAEQLVNRIEDARKRRATSGAGAVRPIAMVLKVKINGIGAGGRCASEIEPLSLEVHLQDSLSTPLVVDLPLEKGSSAVAAGAAPLRAERAQPLSAAPAPAVASAPPASSAFPSAPNTGAERRAAQAPAGGNAQIGSLSNLPMRDPIAEAGPDIVGIKLNMPMDQAEKVAREYLKPELVYELGAEGPSTGYSKGTAFVSLKLGEAIFLYTGTANAGKVSGVERAIVADTVDVRGVQEQYRARYQRPGGVPGLGKSTGTECGVAFNSNVNKPVTKLTSGKVPDAPDLAKTLSRLMGAGRRLHATPLNQGGDRAACGPGIYLNSSAGANPMLLFTLWDHSRATFDPEPPRRAVKL